MKTTLNDLEAVLRREADLHARLLVAAEGKREAIIKGDLPGMEALLATEQDMLRQVEDAEVERQRLTQAARHALGLAGDDPKLAAIIQAAPEPHSARLAQVRTQLRDVLDEFRFRTRQNGELLKASIEHVEAFLRLVAEAARPGAGYGQKGKKVAGSLRLLDRSA